MGGGCGWGLIGDINDAVNDPLPTLGSPVNAMAGYCKAFFTARRWELLVPDYAHAFLTSQAGDPILRDPSYVPAAVASDGSFAVVYYPGVPGNTPSLTVDLSRLGGGLGSSQARWFDPTHGTYAGIDGSPVANAGSRTFIVPGKNAAGNLDWVLVLEAVPGPP